MTREGEKAIALSDRDLARLHLLATDRRPPPDLKRRVNMAGVLCGWECEVAEEGADLIRLTLGRRVAIGAREILMITQSPHRPAAGEVRSAHHQLYGGDHVETRHTFVKVIHPWRPEDRARMGARWAMSIRFYEVFTENGPILIGLTAAQYESLKVNGYDYYEPEALQARLNEAVVLPAWEYSASLRGEAIELNPTRMTAVRANEVLHIRHFQPASSALLFDDAA
jgi:hypothetical protein